MAKQTLLSVPGMQRDALLAQMPPWYRPNPTRPYTRSKTDVYLNFDCPCGQRKQNIYVGKAKGPELAAKLAAAIIKEHEACQTPAAAPPESAEESIAQSKAEIQRLEKALGQQRRYRLSSTVRTAC